MIKLVMQREQAGLELSETLHTSTFRMFKLLPIQNKVHELTTHGKIKTVKTSQHYYKLL